MVEFFGKLDADCRRAIAKRVSLTDGSAFLVATIVLGGSSLYFGIVDGKWIEPLVLTAILLIVTTYAFIPHVREFPFDTSVRTIVDNEKISRSVLGNHNKFISKPLKKIKKVVDMGDWYLIVFRNFFKYPWACQKNLIVQGSLEEFKAIFQDKLKRK